MILDIGESVNSISVGDAICIPPAPLYETGYLTSATHRALGDGVLPGILRRHAVVPAAWIVDYPAYLSFVEASTIGGAGLSAWNALFGPGKGSEAGGCEPRGAKVGDWVVTQGTGAVSLFVAGFAVKAGATVIGTTSSDAKAHWLTDLGVTKVLNYRDDPKRGETARSMTPDGEGVDLVIDVGGATTPGQSLKAIRYEGTVAVTGFLSGSGQGPDPSLMEVLPRAANVNGILAGSKAQYDEMVGMMEQWKFHPVINKRIFGFEEAKEAFQYLSSQKHIGKVVIEICK